MTVIEDDVIEGVAAHCGLAALGLYTLMERRANAKQFAFGSYQDWADMAGMTRRHVIRLMDQLVAGGWVEKVERTTTNGMSRTNAWKLPFHKKGRTDGGDTTSDTDGDIASDMSRAFVSPLKSSSQVVTKVEQQQTPAKSEQNGHSPPPQHLYRQTIGETTWAKVAAQFRALDPSLSTAWFGQTMADAEVTHGEASRAQLEEAVKVTLSELERRLRAEKEGRPPIGNLKAFARAVFGRNLADAKGVTV